MQSRLSASNTAQKAIAKAEEYKYKLEYAKLFSALEKAMEEVEDNTSAYGKVKLAYDGYMSEYKEMLETETTDLETYEDYNQAVSLLESAVLIFPDDYKLKTQLDETKDMRTAVKAISDAENYSNKGDYANLFKTLNKAISELSAGSDAGKKVETAYQLYESNYIAQVKEQVGEPKTVAEFDNAIKTLETAVSALGDNYELKSRLEELKADKPANMFEKTKVYEYFERTYDGAYFIVNQSNIKDNYNNTYFNAAVMYAYNGGYNNQAEVSYDCTGYTKLKGTVAISEDTKDFRKTHTIEIRGSADGVNYTKLASANISAGMKPWTFEIDFSNYTNIQIYTWAPYADKLKIILADFTLSK